jgi:hypothetical protein
MEPPVISLSAAEPIGNLLVSQYLGTVDAIAVHDRSRLPVREDFYN